MPQVRVDSLKQLETHSFAQNTFFYTKLNAETQESNLRNIE